jgi:hypothetical protein
MFSEFFTTWHHGSPQKNFLGDFTSSSLLSLADPLRLLLFHIEAMLASVGFFAKEPRLARLVKLYFNFTFKYLLNCH